MKIIKYLPVIVLAMFAVSFALVSWLPSDVKVSNETGSPVGKAQLDTALPEQTYFAEVDESGTVLRVIVARPEFINSGKLGDPSRWIETEYSGDSKRKNTAVEGGKYDKVKDAFISPKPRDGMTLNPVTLKWDDDVPLIHKDNP